MVKGGYSRCIPEAIMVMEKPPKVISPSARVPGKEAQVIPGSESRRRWNNGYFRVSESFSRVSSKSGKYMPKGCVRGGTPGPGGQRVRPWGVLGRRLDRG